MAADLESHVLGFMLRQQLIHEVRREYEGIVDSIQSPELLQTLPLPLANETIHWPHENILCFPLFTSQEEELHVCKPCHGDESTVLQPTSKQSEAEQKKDELSPVNTVSIPTSTPNHSPQQLDRTGTENTPINSPVDCATHHQGHDDEQQFDESSLNCLLEPLPRDKEALLELRSQLSLELLWIKQAIASRQEYLQLKQQFQSEHSAAE